MKKLLCTLLTALAVCVGLSAEQPAEFKQIIAQRRQAVEQNAWELTTQAPQNVFNVQPHETVAPHNAYKVTMGDTINLTVERWAKTYNSYSNTWDLYFDLFDIRGYSFEFYVIATDLQYNHTYDLGDMMAQYSKGSFGATAIIYDEVFITLWQDADGKDCVDARVVDTDGNVYKITYRPAPLPDSFTDMTLIFNSAEMVDERDQPTRRSFTFTGRQDSIECVLTITADHLTGEFAPSEVLLKNYVPYSYITIYATDGSSRDVEIGKADSVKVVPGPGMDDYICTADLYAYNGVCYHVTFNHIAPAPVDTVDINIKNLVVDNTLFGRFGVMSYTGRTDEYNAEILLYTETDPAQPGTYTLADGNIASVYVMNRLTELEVPIYKHSDVTLVGTTRNDIVISCNILSNDSILYRLSMCYEKPTATRQETINIPLGKLKDYTSDPTMQCYQLMGYTADHSRLASYTINSTTISGTFTMDQMMESYTFVVNDPDSNYAVRYNLVEANVTVAYDAATKIATVNGTMLCANPNVISDVPLFTITMSCRLDEGLQYDTEDYAYSGEYTSDDMVFDKSHLASDHLISMDAENAAGEAMFIDFYVTAEDPDIIILEGVYTIDNSNVPGTVGQSDGVSDKGLISYSFVGTLAADGQGIMSPIWFMREGTVTVSKMNGKLHIEVEATNSYGQTVTAVLGEGVAYDTKHLKADGWTCTDAATGDYKNCYMESRDGTYAFNLAVNASEIQNGHTYTFSDMNAEASYITDMQTGINYSISDATMKWTVDAARKENVTMTAVAEGTEYGITFSGYACTEEVQFVVTDASIDNAIVEYGLFQIYGENAEHTWELSCTMYTDRIAGDYKTDRMFADFTMAIRYPYTDSASVYTLVNSDLHLTFDEQTRLAHLTGTMIARNQDNIDDLPKFIIDMSGIVPEQECLTYDADESNPFVGEFDSEKIIWNNDYVATEGISYMEVHNNDRQMLYIGFVVSELDAATNVPTGTYTIIGSGNSYTVIPSQGATQSNVTASFAAQMNAQGQLNVPAWFMREGTIEVSQDNAGKVKMEINARNSCGATITATVKSASTALDQTVGNVETLKILRDGQLIILRDGAEYDVLGREIH
ncbi:MAG: hypothetical protein MJZ82_01305 [Paludibacteraceae bacterium]|nr:hypothetical protein [Paludibacteraceae bacterium]